MPYDPFVGEIVLWPSARGMPSGWLPCDGRLLPISEYEVLFAVIGNRYGGNGSQNFALPNLAGRVAVGAGTLSGTPSAYPLAQQGGVTDVTLTQNQMPAHQHSSQVSSVTPKIPVASAIGTVEGPPAGGYPAGGTGTARGQPYTYYQYQTAAPSSTVALGGISIDGTFTAGQVGAGQSHTNLQPYLVLQYYIAVMGEFPVSS